MSPISRERVIGIGRQRLHGNDPRARVVVEARAGRCVGIAPAAELHDAGGDHDGAQVIETRTRAGSNSGSGEGHAPSCAAAKSSPANSESAKACR